MQLVCEIEESSEDYFLNRKQETMRPPRTCPHCGRSRYLRALGYYQRDVSRLECGILRISVRRFRCMACRKTVSLLPSFAQPYRIVLNVTIESYFGGNFYLPHVERWTTVMRRYWHRFCYWLPELLPLIKGLGLSPPMDDPVKCWASVLRWSESLSVATMRLTKLFSVTLFGRYRCHFPNPPAEFI